MWPWKHIFGALSVAESIIGLSWHKIGLVCFRTHHAGKCAFYSSVRDAGNVSHELGYACPTPRLRASRLGV